MVRLSTSLAHKCMYLALLIGVISGNSYFTDRKYTKVLRVRAGARVRVSG